MRLHRILGKSSETVYGKFLVPHAAQSKCLLIWSFNCFYHQGLAAQVPVTVSVYSRYQCVRVCLFAPSCPTLCDPMDCSLPGSSVHGILQAKILEWIVLFQGIFPTQGSNLHLVHLPALAGRFFITSAAWEACNLPSLD